MILPAFIAVRLLSGDYTRLEQARARFGPYPLIDTEPGGLELAPPLSTLLMRLPEMHEYCKLRSAFINVYTQ